MRTRFFRLLDTSVFPVRLWAKTSVFIIALVSSVARADSSDDVVRAEALFAEGRRLMATRDYVAACPKFADSQNLNPAPGTALNLAACYERVGKLASAWAAYKTAQAMANNAGQRERAAAAKRKATTLESRVSRLTITVSTNSHAPGLEIRCDQELVHEAEWGVAVPRDGGGHDVQATAPGKETWTTHVELKESEQTSDVEVPPLEDAPSAPAPPAAAQASAPAPESSAGAREAIAQAPSETKQDRPQTQRLVALAVGGLGVGGVVLGSVAGLVASSKYDSAKKSCGLDVHACDPTRQSDWSSLHDSASSWATVSTIAFVAGGAALAAGAVLFFMAPKDKTGPVVGIGPSPQGAGALVSGAFW
jgi:hypothetical protein